MEDKRRCCGHSEMLPRQDLALPLLVLPPRYSSSFSKLSDDHCCLGPLPHAQYFKKTTAGIISTSFLILFRARRIESFELPSQNPQPTTHNPRLTTQPSVQNLQGHDENSTSARRCIVGSPRSTGPSGPNKSFESQQWPRALRWRQRRLWRRRRWQ